SRNTRGRWRILIQILTQPCLSERNRPLLGESISSTRADEEPIITEEMIMSEQQRDEQQPDERERKARQRLARQQQSLRELQAFLDERGLEMPQDNAPPKRTQPGDIWRLGPVRLVVGPEPDPYHLADQLLELFEVDTDEVATKME